MSYKHKILSTLPLGYWRLRSSSITDETITANNGTGGSTIVTSQVTPIVTSFNTDTSMNGCKVNSSTAVNISNIYNAYKYGYENEAFGVEFWCKLDSSHSNQNIIRIGNSNVMRIYVNADTMYFAVTTTGGVYTTKKKVYSWDYPFHVFAISDNRSIKLYINGMSDEVISIDKTHEFTSHTTNFIIGPSTNPFVISDLAFYSRSLSVNEIRSNMLWAQRDSNPTFSSNQGSTSHFNLNGASGQIIDSQSFFNPKDYGKGNLSNLIIDGTGLTIEATETATTVYGEWIYPYTVTSYTDFKGVNIYWDTATNSSSSVSNQYVRVFISYDGGTNYYEVSNGKSVPYFTLNYASYLTAQALIKVVLFTPDASTYQPRIDNLVINVYAGLEVISDSGFYRIYPKSNFNATFKKHDRNILAGSNNLGIQFEPQEPGTNPGVGVISPTTETSCYAIEFWFKWNGSGTAILDSGRGNPDLYISSSSLYNNVSSGKVYLNGVDVTSSNPAISSDNIYHVIVVYPSESSNAILINGTFDGSKVPSKASYGYITIYPNTLTQGQVTERYLSYLTTQVGTIYDHTTNFGSILEYSSANSSMVNSGRPLLSYRTVG